MSSPSNAINKMKVEGSLCDLDKLFMGTNPQLREDRLLGLF